MRSGACVAAAMLVTDRAFDGGSRENRPALAGHLPDGTEAYKRRAMREAGPGTGADRIA